jgi:hypothetical protein
VSLNYLKDSGLQGLTIGLKELKGLISLHLEIQYYNNFEIEIVKLRIKE